MSSSGNAMDQSAVTIMPGINSLDCLDIFFRFLSAKDVARASCVQKHWQRAGSSEHLWKDLLEADWGVLAPVTIQGAALSSHREAYRLWERELGRYNGPDQLPKRAATLWRKLETWFRANIPNIADSLQPGLTEEQLDAIESLLGTGIKLPPAFRLLYRFKNGQHFGEKHTQGLLGGYSFFKHAYINTVLLQLPVPQADTPARLAAQLHPGDASKLMVIGAPATRHNTEKFILLDVNTGEVAAPIIGNIHIQILGMKSEVRLCPPGKTVVDWLEEFANRLESGMYQATSANARSGDQKGEPALSLLPETQAGGMVEQITQGVRIRASAVFVPEQGFLDMHFFTYSVRYNLLSVEEQQARWSTEEGPFRPKLSVQLQSCMWHTRDGNGIRERINPDKSPILTPGEEFQSCNNSLMAGSMDYMDGYLTFVEGTIASPAGPSFNAMCPRFYMVVPDYIY